MKIIKIKDNKITLDLTEKETQILIEYAVNQILKEYIEKEKNKCTNCDNGIIFEGKGKAGDEKACPKCNPEK